MGMLGQLAMTDERDEIWPSRHWLARMASSKALWKLGQLLAGSWLDVTRSAAYAIASIGDDHGLMLLLSSLSDSDPGVQAVAVSPLNMLE